MPYKSKAQAGFMHTRTKEELERMGVNVDEWDKATKAKKGGFKALPEKVKKKD